MLLPTLRVRRSAPIFAALLVGSGALACSGEAPAADGPGQTAGGAGGVAGRTAPTVVLAATDVAAATRTTLEEGTPITGDLKPIESVEVRSRLEGDLIGVFAREGDRVQKGQLLARFEAGEQESDQRSAEAERNAAETALATAEWGLEQSRELFKAGAIPERDLKASEQEVAGARARLAAADARRRSTSSFVTDTRVLAPTSGVVEKRLVENGERLARGAAMFTIVRNDVLELAAAVPSRRATGVRPGQLVRFTAEGRDFDGRVARVSPTIDPATRSVTVYVQVPNGDGSLKGNTSTTGRIVGRVVSDAISVPTSAVRQPQEGTSSPYVYRIEGTVLDQASVRLGLVDEKQGLVEVLEGLREGDRIVVGNVGTLGRGMNVQVAGAVNE